MRWMMQVLSQHLNRGGRLNLGVNATVQMAFTYQIQKATRFYRLHFLSFIKLVGSIKAVLIKL